jgi:hypothetical protein
MFCQPLQLDGRHGTDLVTGSKAKNAQIGWWQAPPNARDTSQWQWRSLYRAGWIMSLVAADMDGDGDLDLLASDRKGASRGCLWLENPGAERVTDPWREHRIGGNEHEVMFLDYADLDGDQLNDVVVATLDAGPVWYRRLKPNDGASRDAVGPARGSTLPLWQKHAIGQPPNTGTGKSVRVADIDLDGRPDLVLSCESATAEKSGVVWLSYRESPQEAQWQAHDISGPAGVKFDLVQLVDLDGDGDLDALECEERDNLGVFWYENPLRSGSSSPRGP